MTLLITALLACNTETSTPATPPPPPAPPAAEPAKEEAATKVFFDMPKDGDTVTNPVKVKMGVEGMEVKAAGEIVEGTGHHHIIIDGAALAKGETVPADEKNIHYGDGSTETELTLEPGDHTLTLQFADGSHASYGPDLSSTIKVTVAEKATGEVAEAPKATPHNTSAGNVRPRATSGGKVDKK